MDSSIRRIRKPVKRKDAEQYLVITLLSFAASVILIRLFLELTGYPQVGNSELHIATCCGVVFCCLGLLFCP